MVSHPPSPPPGSQQIADHIAASIRSGELTPGQQLPSQPELASEWGVARETVRRALEALRHKGLIVTRKGAGSYVRADHPHDQVVTVPVAALRELSEEFVDTVLASASNAADTALWRCPDPGHVGANDLPATAFPTHTDVPQPHPRDGRRCHKCRDRHNAAGEPPWWERGTRDNRGEDG